MSCMCGDTQCPSCGPAQGNWRCPLCHAWQDDGCEHFDEDGQPVKEYAQELSDASIGEEENFDLEPWWEQ
jgi:hypothetical protein